MREGNLAFVTSWIDLEGVIPKPDRERQVLHDITYIWNLNKKKKNIKLIETEWRKLVARGRVCSGGNREKLVTGWCTNFHL